MIELYRIKCRNNYPCDDKARWSLSFVVLSFVKVWGKPMIVTSGLRSDKRKRH